MTATRFINVYEMSKSNNLLDLDLPISSLYLLAAPSTPQVARTEIIERATNGEKLTVAEVRAERSRHLEIYCEEMLGAANFEKIKGTSLDRADEKTALIALNYSAPQGELKPIVKELIDDAAAGGDVSAIEQTVRISVKKLSKRALARVAARKKARASQENADAARLPEETKPASAPDLAPLQLQLQAQIEKLGLFRFRQEIWPNLPWNSSLTNTALSQATVETLIETLEHKISSANTTARRCLCELRKAIGRSPAIEEACADR